jgi:hypothetical protein
MRLQANGASLYVYLLTYCLLFTMAMKVDSFTFNYFIGAIEEINPGESFLLNLSA